MIYLIGGAEGHHEEADQAVRHGEARDQVVGGGVEAALLQGRGNTLKYHTQKIYAIKLFYSPKSFILPLLFF